jgi:pyruvate/2-oxoglutarate dehydrogenase complex dihydrolipoamide acyltransferase (E2) component
MEPTPNRYTLTLPELGAGEMPVTASLWLVEVGDEVSEGDRLLEVCFGAVSVDLPAPASGVLVEMLVAEDDVLRVGQELGVIESFE